MPQPLTREQRAQLVTTAQRGRLLGALAQAGQLASRDMLAGSPIRAPPGSPARIAEPQGNGMQVTFYAEGHGGTPATVYRASVLGGRVTERAVLSRQG